MAACVGYVERNSQPGFKGVIQLFVSIKPKFKHKRRQLGDQIAALGRTTGFFFFFLQTRYTNDSVSVQRVIEDYG